jgi:hypothetical protein
MNLASSLRHNWTQLDRLDYLSDRETPHSFTKPWMSTNTFVLPKRPTTLNDSTYILISMWRTPSTIIKIISLSSNGHPPRHLHLACPLRVGAETHALLPAICHHNGHFGNAVMILSERKTLLWRMLRIGGLTC